MSFATHSMLLSQMQIFTTPSLRSLLQTKYCSNSKVLWPRFSAAMKKQSRGCSCAFTPVKIDKCYASCYSFWKGCHEASGSSLIMKKPEKIEVHLDFFPGNTINFPGVWLYSPSPPSKSLQQQICLVFGQFPCPQIRQHHVVREPLGHLLHADLLSPNKFNSKPSKGLLMTGITLWL